MAFCIYRDTSQRAVITTSFLNMQWGLSSKGSQIPSFSQITVYSSPGQHFTCPEQMGTVCWEVTLPCISWIVSGSLRQVFVKFNAAFKRGEMVSSQNFYVTTRKEKLNATWIP